MARSPSPGSEESVPADVRITPDTSINGEETAQGSEDTVEVPEKASKPKIAEDILLTFGPHRSLFMSLRGRWWYHGAQPFCDTLDKTEMDLPYTVALAPNDSFFVACKNAKKAPIWMYSLPKSNRDSLQAWTQSGQKWILQTKGSGDAWVKLQDWISNNMSSDHEQLRNSTVVFGTGNTFYAMTPQGCIWNNLPSDLEKAIVEGMAIDGRGAPKRVCLGFNGAWVASWKDYTYTWNLGSYYDSVHEKLEASGTEDGSITYLALDPYSSDYFLHHENGLCNWSVQLDDKPYKNFVRRCEAYMQERAREDGTTFSIKQCSRGDKSTKMGYAITPFTTYDSPATGAVNKAMAVLPISHSWSEAMRHRMSSRQWSTSDTQSGAVGVAFGLGLGLLTMGRSFMKSLGKFVRKPR